MHLLPLEKLFQKRSTECPTELPQLGSKYFEQYCGLVNVLRTEYYTKIDAGLAALTLVPGQASGIYTAHDSDHFDEVIVQAGELLGAQELIDGSEVSRSRSVLNAYELYILLVAIRVHDVGNIFGRERHEKKCFEILNAVGSTAGTHSPEKKIIAKIAEAHGGLTSSGSKDTIGALDIVSAGANVTYRPRLLAGVVRIADEICENRRRASNVLLNTSTLPKHSEIYHAYAKSIQSNYWSPVDRAFRLQFWIPLSDVEKAWGCENRARPGESAKTEVYLLDEIFTRLEKMDRERRYCNMHTRDVFTIDSILANVKIVTDEEQDDIEEIKIPELSDRGYPEHVEGGLRSALEKYCGSNYGATLRSRYAVK
jgi:hypothetical protein